MEFLHFLAQYRTPAADIIFQGITYLAQEVFVIAVICWLFWCADKKLAYTLGFSYFISGLLVQGLKITFRVPRPWILDSDFHAVESAVPDATGYSFPSGHTQSITSLFGTLAIHIQKTSARILCFLIVFLVGFSRMYLGCHTPQDVLVSFFISILCAVLCHTLFYRKEILHGRELLVSVCMAIICLLLSAYAVLLYKNGTIELHYAQDCVKASGAGMAFALGYFIEQRYIRFDLPSTAKAKIKRLAFGLLVALALQTGLKPVLGESLPASFFRYFAVVCWILILYPLLFSRKKQR